ncbi:Methyltransferase domain-containing protein [Chryseobacterium rhizoplanae]|uniref:Methyltransferase domain-containing protein n=2 Tax=Chryseobacterium rhizoplanae TaxID=1609531 RepID=A0A521CZ67_9FLAO|nr:Methyltransferase domain-containing protein [Chryseobacterium rhizoplanae]
MSQRNIDFKKIHLSCNFNIINEMSTVLKTFVAYLRRPALYPELGRKIIKNTISRRSPFKGKEKTNSWAASIAVSQKIAVSWLFSMDTDQFRNTYADILEKAIAKEAQCPITMGGPGALELIYYACEYTKAQNVLETGVAYGWSSLAILLSLQKRDGTLYSSDMPYLAQDGDEYVGYVVPENLKKYWKLFRFADRESLPKIFKQVSSFDVFHYDSDKSYHGRMWAYHQIYKRLKPGAVFISDDIGDNSAYQDFCAKKNINTTVVEYSGKYIGVFIKQ